MMAATVSATTESPVLGATGGHFPLASAAISDHIVSVQVPAESKPGQSLRVRTPNGREAELQIPEGVRPGDIIQVAIPSHSAQGNGVPSDADAAERGAVLPHKLPQSTAYPVATASIAQNSCVRPLPSASAATPVQVVVATRQGAHGQDAALGNGLPQNEVLVLSYRYTVRCLALIDIIFTLLSLASANRSSMVFFALATLPGPICGYYGANRLSRPLVTVYLLFCFLKLVLDVMFCVITGLWIYILFIVIQLWVFKVVKTFWTAMSRLPDERIRDLRDPAVMREAEAQARFLYW